MRTHLRIPSIRRVLITFLIILETCPKVLSQEYFQQEVNYRIHVTLNDKYNELNAFETIEYINNAYDTLQFLYFHLWPNAYSNNNTELASQLTGLNGKARLFNDPELQGYIDSLDFKVDGRQVQWNVLPGKPDICLIWLNKEIRHGDTLMITTPFHVKIPKGVTSRFGHTGDSYQISQWYPKPAVYDRSGWHPMSYLDQGEYYSEFGTFDVRITLPANYIVGATGNLQNAREAELLNKLAADTAWITMPGNEENEFPPSSEQNKTLRYNADHIHDFAWFADKRFHVLKGKVKLPDSGREVTTWVMFPDQQAYLWKDAIPYVNNAIKCFSKWNGDYPYQSFTAVNGALSAGNGMEYPGIAIIGVTVDAWSLEEVIAHEIGHNWFYSALGSNERRYPFMDEGITSACEVRYMNERYPQKKLWEVYIKNLKLAEFFHIQHMPVKMIRELEWLSAARDNLEQPINLTSEDYTTQNYSLMIYNKAGSAFNYLRAYLGDSLYDSVMHDYYHIWKFRHPQPYDLCNVFETVTGKNLSWFFNDLLGTIKRIDYKLVRVTDHKLLVKNKGELASPLVIAGMFGDSICFEKWVDGFEGQKWIEIPNGNYTELKIDPRHVTPELFRLNNNIRTTGILCKADPVRTQLYFSLENPEKRTVMYFPGLNWTRENGYMVGLAMHNRFFTPKPLEYFFMPFFAFHNDDLAGFGRISYNITPYDKFIRKAVISLEGTQFGAPANQNFHKIKTGLDLYFRTHKMNYPLRQKVFGNYISASDLARIELQQKATMISYLQVGYQLDKTSITNPFSLLVSAESGQSLLKTSVAFNYRISYYDMERGLDIRFFAGTMLKKNPDVPFYSFSPNGRSGNEQYLFQGMYPDRFTAFPATFWSRQMSLTEGGLVSPVSSRLGYSQWLISLSFTSNLTKKLKRIPVKPFINFLLNDHGTGTGRNSPFFIEGGLKTGFWNFFEFYIPFIVSSNIESSTGSFKDRIRLVFNLDSFNEVKLNSGTKIQIQ
ncbi:MAG: M1 family metallopeptidase [Bacteroidetes bacterium]|nr:M1 family metallopeptidase [Bacteroidota bacterium]